MKNLKNNKNELTEYLAPSLHGKKYHKNTISTFERIWPLCTGSISIIVVYVVLKEDNIG